MILEISMSQIFSSDEKIVDFILMTLSTLVAGIILGLGRILIVILNKNGIWFLDRLHRNGRNKVSIWRIILLFLFLAIIFYFLLKGSISQVYKPITVNGIVKYKNTALNNFKLIANSKNGLDTIVTDSLGKFSFKVISPDTILLSNFDNIYEPFNKKIFIGNLEPIQGIEIIVEKNKKIIEDKGPINKGNHPPVKNPKPSVKHSNKVPEIIDEISFMVDDFSPKIIDHIEHMGEIYIPNGGLVFIPIYENQTKKIIIKFKDGTIKNLY